MNPRTHSSRVPGGHRRLLPTHPRTQGEEQTSRLSEKQHFYAKATGNSLEGPFDYYLRLSYNPEDTTLKLFCHNLGVGSLSENHTVKNRQVPFSFYTRSGWNSLRACVSLGLVQDLFLCDMEMNTKAHLNNFTAYLNDTWRKHPRGPPQTSSQCICCWCWWARTRPRRGTQCRCHQREPLVHISCKFTSQGNRAQHPGPLEPCLSFMEHLWHLLYSQGMWARGLHGHVLVTPGAQSLPATQGWAVLARACGGRAGVLAPGSPFSLHALVRVYYFLSSNCRSQVIISLWRENNIGSYVISTSMNLEAIMEWVDSFSLLKKEKNKFEIVCIWLRIFMNYSPLFPHPIFYPVRLCVV